MEKIVNSLKPHLIALFVGFIVLFAYFPSIFLESKVINMGDINRSSATSKEIRDYREQTGIEPLWTNSQFGGMPAFQMNVYYPSNLMAKLERASKGVFPSKLGLLFTMFIGFYFLSFFLGNKVWISLIGAFAFTFSTFFIVSMEAGHTGKLRAIGYMAPVLIGVIATMRGKYLLGGALTTLMLSMSINANHYQITYYLAIMIMVYLIVEAVYHFKEKTIKPFLIKCSILAVAALLSVGPNVSRLWTTYDYSKETMRGGSSELSKYEDSEGGGLEKDYAMSWSYGLAETFTLIIPDFYGGSSTGSLDEKSNTAEDLRKRGLPKNQVKSIIERLPLYWGDQPFTSGPVFLGAVVMFLFVISLFVLQGRLKVWLLSVSILSIVLSWGSNFAVVNDLFFYYFPMYNKFRVPSMMLSVTSLTIPLMGILALNKMLQSPNGLTTYMPEIKKAFYITGGLCLFFLLLGSSLFSFSGSGDAQLPEGWPIEALVADRKSMLSMGALKSLIFIVVAFLSFWAYAKNKISLRLFVTGICLSIVVDLWMVDKKYLNDTHFVKRKNRDDFYNPNKADKLILQDQDPHYRVFNLSVNPFTDAMTSYFHHSVGGYHGAKLIRYQDMIDEHLSQNNPRVIDMLDTRYYIVRDQQSGQVDVKGNPGALGAAWFVDEILWVKNADEEIESLHSFDPKTQVVVDERYQNMVGSPMQLNKQSSEITLLSYVPNNIFYDVKVTNGPQLAVFSEIYYEGTDNDWKVYLNGEPAEHFRVNYILRGMVLPEGEYQVEFKFEPKAYFQGERISMASSIVVLILVIGMIVVEIRKSLITEVSDSETNSQ